MAEENSTDGAQSGDAPREDSIARLINLAGPRPTVPEDVQARVRASVRAEWRRVTVRRRTPRWMLPAALAASVVLAAVLAGLFLANDAEPIATVAVAYELTQESGTPLATGDPVFAGDTIVTGPNGAALGFPNGLSLRFAGQTTATLNAADEITIVAGRIYADTGPSVRDERRITVNTPVGSASDRGTQFVVGYDDLAMTVAVRRGSVDVSGRRASWTADAGQKLTVQPDEEAVFDEVGPQDGFWDWTAALAPVFDIENRSIFDFLNWAAQETGRDLVFANDSVRRAAMASTLSGSIAGFTPSEAIEAVLPTTRFEVRIESQRMFVAVAQ